MINTTMNFELMKISDNSGKETLPRGPDTLPESMQCLEIYVDIFFSTSLQWNREGLGILVHQMFGGTPYTVEHYDHKASASVEVFQGFKIWELSYLRTPRNYCMMVFYEFINGCLNVCRIILLGEYACR